jgi:hypothetical protein
MKHLKFKDLKDKLPAKKGARIKRAVVKECLPILSSALKDLRRER